jgi:hypothetical protein
LICSIQCTCDQVLSNDRHLKTAQLFGFKEMVERCRTEFPKVWQRLPFETVVNTSVE